MTQKTWSDVDVFYEDLLVKPDSRFEKILQNSSDAGLPSIQVSACQGKFLELLARFRNARRILEIGTLGGYSTAWLARGLPQDGKLITLEIDPDFAAVARESISLFDFASRIELIVGDARESLQRLAEAEVDPFDIIFIDADKTQYGEYLDWSLILSGRGTLIIADNVVRNGRIIDENINDQMVKGIREFNLKVAGHRELETTVLQTVGTKGYDGFSLIYVNS